MQVKITSNITVFGPANCTINNKYRFVIYNVPPTCFGLYRVIGEAHTKAYKYSELCQGFLSFHVTVLHRNKFLYNKTNQTHQFHKFILL